MEENEDKALPVTNDTVFPAGKYIVGISSHWEVGIVSNLGWLGDFFEEPYIFIENETTGQKWETGGSLTLTDDGFAAFESGLKVKIRKKIVKSKALSWEKGVRAYTLEFEKNCGFTGIADFPEGFSFSDVSCEYMDDKEYTTSNFEIHHKNSDGSESSMTFEFDSSNDGETHLFIGGGKVDIYDSEYDEFEISDHLREIGESDSLDEVYQKLGFTDFCEIQYSEDKTVLEECRNKKVTNVEIPESVTEINNFAFEDCTSLTSVTIPKGVTEIGFKTFAGCSSLTSVTIPNSVTRIDTRAFKGCKSLSSITIPDSVTEIFSYAFEGCSSLTSVTIPGSVTKSGYCVFLGCSSLTSVTISEGVRVIGGSEFEGCSSLTSVTIPDSVTEIDDYAFKGCSSLTSVSIPESVTRIGDYAFADCKSLASITIPDNVKEISSYAFANCAIDTLSHPSITIQDSLVIEYGVVKCVTNCNLTKISIPRTVTGIEQKAFKGCTSLSEISYDGTIAQWGYVKKQKNWNAKVPAKTVKCTDGETSLDEPKTTKKNTKKATKDDSGLQWLF